MTSSTAVVNSVPVEEMLDAHGHVSSSTCVRDNRLFVRAVFVSVCVVLIIASSVSMSNAATVAAEDVQTVAWIATDNSTYADDRPTTVADDDVDDATSSSDRTMACTDDSDCRRTSDDLVVCCSGECLRTCPDRSVHSACELQRMMSEERARSLASSSEKEVESVRRPRCLSDGRFEPVQCDHDQVSRIVTGDDGDDGRPRHCWCVDEGGFEIGGTRVNGSREDVDCISPRPCAGHLCRMLCPFDFELDEDGCPLCQCRDPCRGVRCPSGTLCHLEVVSCSREPCPPVPTCKKARSLDTVCSIGRALTISDKDKLFLCGLGPTKPQCPSFFDCEIEPGRDYGVCCPSPDKLLKPGSCPDMSKSNVSCDSSSCYHDMECEGLQKCCESKECGGGFTCVHMAENTVCLQQRILAELLSSGELAGRGYIPQCSKVAGHFEPRQCSRNGKVCWCVHVEDGAKIPRTMGPADTVQCLAADTSAAATTAFAAATVVINDLSNGADSDPNDIHVLPRRSCDTVICTGACPYGHGVDENGCQTCDCADLCESVRCPSDMQCVVVENEFCVDDQTCDSFPICKPPPILYAKPGNCPPQTVPKSSCVVNASSCSDDSRCPTSLKCCSIDSCRSVCVEPLRTNLRLPTMCEYLRDFVSNAVDKVRSKAVALTRPNCDHDGSFERIQCDGMECWCVDEFGSELQSTRTDASVRPKMDCDTALRRKSCDGLLCRLGCDYGFERDHDGCQICECRDPCQGVHCVEGFRCQMVEVNCYGGFCPSVPQCVPDTPTVAVCPAGQPLTNAANNVTRACGKASPCPSTYFCHIDERIRNDGVCCRKPVKAGQCPYRFVARLGHCENASTCEADHQCPDEQKCCSDGCKYSCVEPEMKTACEHATLSAQYMSEERSLVLGEPVVPRCDNETGAFDRLQCRGRLCWCADPSTGLEIPGTRDTNARLNCTDPVDSNSTRPCPPLPSDCDLRCPHGHRMSDKGCPICECRDPCDDFLCSKRNEECVSVRVNCITERCQPFPMCVLRSDNPCPHGQKIKNRLCSSLPGFPSCPSTHVCLQNPILDVGSVCCSKSRDDCLRDPELEKCAADESKGRWIFSILDNECVQVPSGKCPTSTNNFRSKADCTATCPVLSECERSREKAQSLAKKAETLGFVPKCRKDGDYEAVQCLPEVGFCWCVSGSSGVYLKGSAVRGTPRCGSARMGRKLDAVRVTGSLSTTTTGSVCPEDGHVVHLCDASLCKGKVCLGRPNAVCRVDPCDGCRYVFQEEGQQVDCEEGLSVCQREVQMVLNTDGWSLRVARVLGEILGPELDESASKLVVESLLGLDSHEGTANEMSATTHSAGSSRARSVEANDVDVLGMLHGAARVSIQQSADKRPEESQHQPPLMVVVPPRCTATGEYEPVQSQGELSWCVDAHGHPVHSTLTRTSTTALECGVASNRSSEHHRRVCSDPNRNPRVCTDECLRSECPSHPDAVCVADPCDDCRVRFAVNEETVDCQERCLQPLTVGMCRASIARYHFNSTSAACEAFVYGGCLGNDNNFESEKQCRDACVEPVDVCSLPKRVGMCRASMKRWWFNEKTHKCERFIFGGCDGNANNFESREQCEATCPDVVLCPRLPPSTMAADGLQGCRRTTACANRTRCDSDPSAVCTADACDCRSRFVDYDGNPVDCSAASSTTTTTVTSVRDSSTSSVPLTACQKRRRHVSSIQSSASVPPQCSDDDGRFLPTQCESKFSVGRNESGVECWCVDEAGNRLTADVNRFPRGSRADCRFVKVGSLLVSLIFEHGRDGGDLRNGSDEKQIRRDMAEFLNGATSSIDEHDVTVDVRPHVVQVNVTLRGSDKVDAAYTLREKMDAGVIVLRLGRLNLRPGGRSFVESRLLSDDHASTDSDEFDVDDGSDSTVAICISLVALISVMLLAIYALVRRRKSRGYRPRGDSTTGLSPVNNFGYGSVTSPAIDGPSNHVYDIVKHYDELSGRRPPVHHALEHDHHYEVLERTADDLSREPPPRNQ